MQHGTAHQAISGTDGQMFRQKDKDPVAQHIERGQKITQMMLNEAFMDSL